jgi:plastocyanin
VKRKLVVSLAAAGLAAAIAIPSASAAAKINGAFSGFTISLSGGAKSTGADGKVSLKPGNRTFVLNDTSGIHNFVLEKGKGNPSKPKPVKATNGKAVVTDTSPTATGKTGKSSFTVKLVKGTYTLYCQPHYSVGMKVTLTVK